ncbi:helix-turn-helix domain-containing protein [Anaerobacterium chartisolvens]|uniref:helix-turn-helix domain-containing protein n=1 Tax=Anaerobacterium chartisolvens TaxID=1297424 RepID=UPI000DF38EE6|nr:helix-turn-helix domain-containing protein [Anaerobacterium chartisolvens]
MLKIRTLILQAKAGDQEAFNQLRDIFNPMIIKYSYLFGSKDEDLYSELIIAFIKCINKFEINEYFYINQFEAYLSNIGSQENF